MFYKKNVSHKTCRELHSLKFVYYFFLLADQKVNFLNPKWKKIVFNRGKTFILLVWLLPSLFSGIKLQTRKINFFLPSCIMYYLFRIYKKENFVKKILFDIIFSKWWQRGKTVCLSWCKNITNDQTCVSPTFFVTQLKFLPFCCLKYIEKRN